MCLANVEKVVVKTGYKIMQKHIDYDGTIVYENYDRNSDPNNGKRAGLWYTAKAPLIHSDMGQEYAAGFHIFLTMGEAALYPNCYYGEINTVVVQVQYKYVLARGEQKGLRSITALYMQIVKEVGSVGDVRKRHHIGNWRVLL